MTGTDMTTQQQFEQSIMDKLRTDIGNLMPPELLQKLINRAIEESFFKERTKKGPRDWDRVEVQPSVFVETVHTLMQENVNMAIEKWMQDNAELVAEKLKELVNMKAEALALTALTALLNGPVYAFQDKLRQALQEKGININLY